ncbi:hypothetical protein Ae201684_008862 [Aphanomyces euteiches]|uniref:Uncharacterized protein n=1 Tax=Aphanomyces euteiches TaxID=100861 RepID=A0A6G0X3L1_9STRA|nr:hypothetical protein Ae201684_008862 [Aphanomyces euteiches]
MSRRVRACEFCAEPGVHDGRCDRHQSNLCTQSLRETWRKATLSGSRVHQQCKSIWLLLQHGSSSKSYCTYENCTNVAHARGRCVKHGGGRQCQWVNCPLSARHEGFCRSHYLEWTEPLAAHETPNLTSEDWCILTYFLTNQAQEGDTPTFPDSPNRRRHMFELTKKANR